MDIRISLAQIDISWENKKENLQNLKEYLIKLKGETDLVVLPEMFTTGFTMNSRQLAEPITGETITRLKEWSAEFNIALCGSFICEEKNNFYNRAFFLTPEQEEYYYDKKHLFRMGEESHHFHSGNHQCIVHYKGWNILLAICYDLRFPVWLRNVDNSYDLLIVVANWPDSRKKVWESLLVARALENQCYVCGVNRVGKDGSQLNYAGQSVLLNAKGEACTNIKDYKQEITTVSINLPTLQAFRNKFPVWKDADKFELK